MAQVAGAPYPGGAAQQQPPPGPPGGGYHRAQPQPQPAAARPRQPPPAGQQQQQHGRPPGNRRPPAAAAAAAGGGRHGGGGQHQAAKQPALSSALAADNMADLEQLRRITPFMCNIRFRNNLPEIPSDPKLIMSTYEPDRLSKFFLTTVEQQPRRELLLPADVGVPISVMDLERYDLPDDLGPRPKLEAADEILLQDVEGLPSGAGGVSSSIRDVKRSKKGDVSWLMATTYLTSGGEPAMKRGGAAAAGNGRFQMGSTQQPQELTREQLLADIEATFTSARGVPRHPTKPGVTAVRCVPILPDLEAWPNKYVVVQFPEDDPKDSRTLAKVDTAEKRRDLLSHSLLKSYQTQGGSGTDLTVGLLVPHDLAGTAIAGGELPDEQLPEDMAGDYSWDCEYNFDLQQNDAGQPQQQLLLMMHDDKMGYCNLDGSLKLKKRKRLPTDEPRPAKAIVEHRDYHDNEIAERRDRLAAVEIDPTALPLDDAEADLEAEGNIFGGGGAEEAEAYQEDAEGAEQGGLGYQ